MTLRTRSANLGGTVITSTGVVLSSGLDVSTQADAAYVQANTARNTANSAFNHANNAFDHANSAFAHANTIFDQANAAYLQANTARSDANTTFATINTSLGTINTNYQAAYSQANAARSDANTTFATINTSLGIINTTFGTVNTAVTNAHNQANSAFAAANLRLSTSGGSISGDLAITGNLTVTGNATTINVSNLSVNDSMILLSTNAVGDSNDIGFIGHFDRGATATHAGLIRKATQNQFYLFDNYEVEPSNNVIDVTGNNFRVGNLRLGIINANSFVTSAGLDVTGQANAAYGQANTARSDANTTFATVNTTFGTINTNIGTAYTQANNAFAAANNRVATVSGTSGRITSSGTTGITLDLATAGAGAASYSSGISALTVDAYGRVTAVTGSANYVPTNGTGATGTWGISISGNAGTVTNGVYQNQYGSFQSSFTNNINADTNRNVGAYGSYASAATNTPTNSGILLNFTSGSDGSGDGLQIWSDYNNANNLYQRRRWGGSWSAWGQIWTAGNDGTGSGLDADLWDGYQFADYLNQAVKTTSTPTFTGLTVSNTIVGSINGNAATVTNGMYLNAAQTSSVRKAFAGSQNVGSLQNAGGSLGGLELISNSNGDAAFLCFHKPGNFASYFGIDTDNQFAVGGWSAGATLAHFKCQGLGVGTASSATTGQIDATASIRTPIFYDSNDTNAYFDGSAYNGSLIMRNIAPTIIFRDTDHFSAMLHCNSNLLYVLRGGNDTTSWSQVNSQWPFIFYLGDNNALCGGSFSAVGNVTAYSSDRRLKTNIQKIPNALDKVLSLNGVTFDWIDRVKELGFTPDTMINDAGVIAQEVQEVLPQAVKPAPFDYQWDTDKNDYASRSGEDFITVQYEKIVPLLIEAIKELKAEIDNLKQRG